MNPAVHRLYIASMILVVVFVLLILTINGMSYYSTDFEERFFHENHDLLKPSGLIGHGIGILGTLLILIGVATYMMRKRFRSLSRFGLMKHWLEFHIFLCVLGPMMVLFHTAFKFGGIVSISFWSMVAVVVSGVIGRFIYRQIPRSIEGRELTLAEIHRLKEERSVNLLRSIGDRLPQVIFEHPRGDGQKVAATVGDLIKNSIRNRISDRQRFAAIRQSMVQNRIERRDQKVIMQLVKKESQLLRRIENLIMMQRVFRYWHVAHLPFAMIMLTIVVIHVAVTLLLGYQWIF